MVRVYRIELFSQVIAKKLSMYIDPGDVKYIDENVAILGCYNLDGAGYIHALLEGFHPIYSRIRNGNYRIYLAKSIRLGAIPEIIRTNFKVEDLKNFRPNQKHFFATNPFSVYENASVYGVSLRPELLKFYAKYLRVSYRLFSVDLDLLEEYRYPASPPSYANILKVSNEEYHLLIRPHKSREEDAGKLQYTVFDVKIF